MTSQIQTTLLRDGYNAGIYVCAFCTHYHNVSGKTTFLQI